MDWMVDTALRQSQSLCIIHRELTYKQKKLYFLVKRKKTNNNNSWCKDKVLIALLAQKEMS